LFISFTAVGKVLGQTTLKKSIMLSKIVLISEK